MTDTPGLISRVFYTEDGAQYVREEWDLTVPGCPVIAVDNTKWGTGESIIDPHVTGVTWIKRLGAALPPERAK